jgi:polysaccharide biosynthesis/export protein
MKIGLMVMMSAGCFAQTPGQRSAVESGTANLPVQKVGPNDLIGVSVYDSPELTRTIRVGSDGRIRLPMLKQAIQAAGKMPDELERVIAEAFVSEHIIVDPSVTVTVAEYGSRPISVAGSVRAPLTFQATGPVTLLEAITRAGGLSPEAGHEILVSNKMDAADAPMSNLVRRIPVKSLIDLADPEVNLRLTGGEEVRVPELGKIFVIGNVKKPGAYPIQGDADTTVLTVLALAEGLTPNAGNQAYVLRREAGAGSKSQIAVELKKIMDRKVPDRTLMASDVLYVPDNSTRRLGLAALERILLFGSTAGATALIWH